MLNPDHLVELVIRLRIDDDPDPQLDAEIAVALNIRPPIDKHPRRKLKICNNNGVITVGSGAPTDDHFSPARYTGSLDAAMEITERFLPGQGVTMIAKAAQSIRIQQATGHRQSIQRELMARLLIVFVNAYDQLTLTPDNFQLPITAPPNERPMAETLQPLVRAIIHHAIRNNTTLEDLHAGIYPGSKTGDYSDVFVTSPFGKIPWTRLSRFNDVEMKTLIKEIVTNLNAIFARIDDPEFQATLVESHGSDWKKWDEPDPSDLAKILMSISPKAAL